MKSDKAITLIKIGGRAASAEPILLSLFREMKKMKGKNHFILVHGGGAEVSKISSRFGFAPRFKEGIRMTGPEEMEIVDMVLAGKMNKYLVRIMNTVTPGAGISGSDGLLFTGESIDKENPRGNRTGSITRVQTGILETLIRGGYIPVVATTSMDAEGRALNINADEAALHLAAALHADNLVFLSDIAGIVHNGEVFSALNEESAEEAIKQEIITDGMIPKVRSSIQAIHHGVGHVIIGQFTEEGDLSLLLSGKTGTYIS